MAEKNDTGEKTEQPTPRRLEEALKHGQIARSAEVQTAFVLLGALAALTFAGPEIWRQLVAACVITFSHLHDTTLTAGSLQGYAVTGTFVFLKCAAPVVIATMLPGFWPARSRTVSTPRRRRSRPIGSG